jgi:hypothetical protein
MSRRKSALAPGLPAVIDGILLGLLALDSWGAVVAFFLPAFWFEVFHGAAYVDPQGLLRRMGANWTAFAILQLLAWRRWRRNPEWLLVIAGARWSDALTDWTYLTFARDTTLFAKATLLGASPTNVMVGLYLFRSYSVVRKKSA